MSVVDTLNGLRLSPLSPEAGHRPARGQNLDNVIIAESSKVRTNSKKAGRLGEGAVQCDYRPSRRPSAGNPLRQVHVADPAKRGFVGQERSIKKDCRKFVLFRIARSNKSSFQCMIFLIRRLKGQDLSKIIR